MNKKGLIETLIRKLEEERATLAAAAKSTYEAATHEESEAEDQYDTRGLEASYLAGAQAKRVAEVEKAILLLRYLNPHDFKDGEAIRATALVELDHDGKRSFCLLLPEGGGMSVVFEGHHVQVITPRSPLGEALIGRSVGDEVVVDVGKQTHEYEIVAVH